MTAELESDESLFDLKHLRQIDRLHSLLFDWLIVTEKRARENITEIVKSYESSRWNMQIRRDPGGYNLIGLLPLKHPLSWPNDLLVHFGCKNDHLLREAWVGLDTSTADLNFKQQLIDCVRPAFDELWEEPKLDGRYIIWQSVPEWPYINPEWISKNDKLERLASILPGGDSLGWIKDRFAKLLTKLELLADG